MKKILILIIIFSFLPLGSNATNAKDLTSYPSFDEENDYNYYPPRRQNLLVHYLSINSNYSIIFYYEDILRTNMTFTALSTSCVIQYRVEIDEFGDSNNIITYLTDLDTDTVYDTFYLLVRFAQDAGFNISINQAIIFSVGSIAVMVIAILLAKVARSV